MNLRRSADNYGGANTRDHGEPETKPSNTFGAIPYVPGLKQILPNVTCAVLVTYLEMRFPAPQESRMRISSLPVEVILATVCEDLQISRRTLGLNLHALARVYREEAQRWSCARAYREFIQQHHRKKGTRKLYSIVCDHNLERAQTFILRRNLPLLNQAFANCGMTAISLHSMAQAWSQNGTQRTEASSELTKVAAPPLLVSAPRSLAEILLSASQLSGDRRSLRYPRLRKAVADGLASPDVLKVQRAKRTKNNGVIPELPEEVVDRLIHLHDDKEQDC